MTTVVAVMPRRDPSLVISVRQLLSVEPFFVADLRAEVAGVVRYVQKAINDPVQMGEVLVTLEVPHLEQELREKEAVILQREQDLRVAHAQEENARAMVDVYREIIEQRRAEFGQAEATRDYRAKRYARFTKLAAGGGVQEGIVEEEQRDYLAADYAAKGAAAAIRKAAADAREKESAQRIAEADIELKESLVEVARKDRDHARVMLDYAQIKAPWDGVVVKRKVDVGTFVQNASTGQSEPILTIARNDIVTLVMKVPDNAAPFVTRDTEAIVQIDELPNVVIRGKVTRYSPSIQNADRTMRVEVDLYNDTAENYQRYVAKIAAARIAGFASHTPLGIESLLLSGRTVWDKETKSTKDPLPQLPKVSAGTTVPKLLPGMSGYMRLNLKSFRDAYLLPSSAVFTRGGKPYLMEVKDGVTHLLPVHVQVNDGKLTKVTIIAEAGSPTSDEPEVLRELTGNEVIILNRQSELSEGQPVKVTLEKW